METGYVMSENEGGALKLVRDPSLVLQVPDGLAIDELLSRLLSINRMLSGEAPLGRVLDQIAQTVLEVVRGTSASVYTVAPGGELREEAHRYIQDPEAASTSVVREVLSGGRAIILYDAAGDSHFGAAESIASSGLRSILCVPLVVEGRTTGAIYAANRCSPGLFTSADLFLIEAFADQAALALEVARLQHRNRALSEQLRAQLDQRTEELAETQGKLQEALKAHSLRYQYDRIVHQSAPMRRVLEIVDRVTDSELPVLVIGESGTGKELIARALHHNGRRRQGPFVAVNCGAIAGTVFESEFFGHLKGSFTGADRPRKGHFEAASGGTLFLDEVGELELPLQVKLLRALQEGEVMPVGSSAPIKVDVRVVAATNKPLEAMIAQGTFRQDLYYRIGVVRIDLPPLRERPDDIPPLVERFIADLADRRGGASFRIPPQVMRALQSYTWPGNVRELENAVSYMSIFASTGLEQAPLPFLRGSAPLVSPPNSVAPPSDSSSSPSKDSPASGPVARAAAISGGVDHTVDATVPLALGSSLAQAERQFIEATLVHFGDHQGKAAQALGIDRATLYRKMRGWKLRDDSR